jgi:hypothetical protein
MNPQRKTRWKVIQRDTDRQRGALQPRRITDDRYSIICSLVENCNYDNNNNNNNNNYYYYYYYYYYYEIFRKQR